MGQWLKKSVGVMETFSFIFKDGTCFLKMRLTWWRGSC